MKPQWTEFYQALQCMAGAACHDGPNLGDSRFSPWGQRKGFSAPKWSNIATSFWFESRDLSYWRLGWLWAEYEDKGPLSARHPYIRYKFTTPTPMVKAVAALDLQHGTWRAIMLPSETLATWLSAWTIGELMDINEDWVSPELAAALFPIEAKRFKWEN